MLVLFCDIKFTFEYCMFLVLGKVKQNRYHVQVRKLNFEFLLNVCEELYIKLILGNLKIKFDIFI